MDSDRDLRAWVLTLALGVGFFLIGLGPDLYDVRGWTPPAVLDRREPPPRVPKGWTTPSQLQRMTRTGDEDLPPAAEPALRPVRPGGGDERRETPAAPPPRR